MYLFDSYEVAILMFPSRTVLQVLQELQPATIPSHLLAAAARNFPTHFPGGTIYPFCNNGQLINI